MTDLSTARSSPGSGASISGSTVRAGDALGKRRETLAANASCESAGRMSHDTATSARSDVPRQLTFSAEDSRARTSRWLDGVLAWLESDPGSGSSSVASLLNALPVGFSSRMSLGSSPPTGDGTWAPSSEGSWNSGTAWPGGCLTLATSECPSAAVECSLSAILESPGPHLRRYCLSPKAAMGILRRSEKRGRTLPAPLAQALRTVAGRRTPNA